ncbi:cadherin-related family member 3-like [Lissotriton helveticus]
MKMFLQVSLLLGMFPGFFALPTIEITPRSVSLPENAAKNEVVPVTINTTATDGPPVIINANPVEHPFRITPKSANEWEIITTGIPELDFETVPLYSLQILVKDKRGSSASQLLDIRISDVNEAPVFTGALASQGRVRKELKRATKHYFLENAHSVRSPTTLWEAYKTVLRGHAINTITGHKKRQSQELADLEIKLRECTAAHESQPSPAAMHALALQQQLYNDHLRLVVKGHITETQNRIYEVGDKAGKMLAWLDKREGNSRGIQCLKDEQGEAHTDPRRITELLASHFEQVYTPAREITPECAQTLLAPIAIRTLSPEASCELEADITADEIQLAIKALNPGKALGPNGIPIEWYQMMPDTLGEYLLEMFEDCLEKGTLPPDQRTATIIPILKPGAEVYIPENIPVGTPIYRVAARDPEKDVLEAVSCSMGSVSLSEVTETLSDFDILVSVPEPATESDELLNSESVSDGDSRAELYSIENISPAGTTAFTIDTNGAISTAETFDYDAGTKSYALTIKVSDGVSSIIGNVKVFLTNVNDNDPVLSCRFSSISDGKQVTKDETSTSGSKVEIELYEERPIGTTVNTCTATDADQMNDLTFRLDPGNPYFTVNRETGTVIISSKMDAEETGFVNVQSFSVKVCDEDLKCASIPVTVKILGINDNPPICDPYLYSFAQPEIIPGDTIVATLNCQDPDKPPNPLTYEPHSGPVGDGQLFQHIPDFPNIIQVKKDLTYDTDPETTYEIMISVSDDEAPPHTVTTTIIVSVTPVNNFRPEFVAPETYVFTVPETSGAGYVVGTVRATDEDKPPCVRYGITSGDTETIKLFWINRETGAIELTTNPDYETTPQYTLAVEAVDCDPVAPRRNVATVKVNIKEENDEAPVCLPHSYSAIILDNVTAGMNINSFKLLCKDRDSNDTAMRFEIVSGNVNNHFTFDPTRGSHNPKLIVKNPFNFDDGAEVRRKYNLLVHIIDDNLKGKKEARAMTGSVLIDINVIRSNPPSVPPTSFEQRAGLTIVTQTVNTFSSTDWYVPLIFTFMALFLAGLLAWSCHLIWKYTNIKEWCQKSQHKVPKKKAKTYQPGTKKEPKLDVITEMTTYETVFDGEAIDPVTGQLYEFNSRSGARRWKTTPQPKFKGSKLTEAAPEPEQTVLKRTTPPKPVTPSNVKPLKLETLNTTYT